MRMKQTIMIEQWTWAAWGDQIHLNRKCQWGKPFEIRPESGLSSILAQVVKTRVWVILTRGASKLWTWRVRANWQDKIILAQVTRGYEGSRPNWHKGCEDSGTQRFWSVTWLNHVLLRTTEPYCPTPVKFLHAEDFPGFSKIRGFSHWFLVGKDHWLSMTWE